MHDPVLSAQAVITLKTFKSFQATWVSKLHLQPMKTLSVANEVEFKGPDTVIWYCLRCPRVFWCPSAAAAGDRWIWVPLMVLCFAQYPSRSITADQPNDSAVDF